MAAAKKKRSIPIAGRKPATGMDAPDEEQAQPAQGQAQDKAQGQNAPAGSEAEAVQDGVSADEAVEDSEGTEGAEAGDGGDEASAEDADAGDEPVDSDSADAEAAEDEADDDEADDDEAEGGSGDAGDQPDIFTAIKQEVVDLRDRYARLQAEWDNFRKRTAAERKQERIRAAEGLATDLLPVLDDLERAIKHAKDAGEGGSLTEGVEAIQGKLLQTLKKHKVELIEAQGQPFDAMVHQAVGTKEDDSVPEETVVEVYQQGYTMGERVLRPAMVVTSTGGPMREADGAEEGQGTESDDKAGDDLE